MSANVIIREQYEYNNSTTESAERISKEKEYISYLAKHIANVNKMYNLLFIPLLEKDIDCYDAPFTLDELRQSIINVKPKIEKHDNSKWSEQEFPQYRAHWDPTDEELNRGIEYQNQVDLEYQEAWIHHYKNNDHHPKYWYDFENNIARDMSLEAIIHMLCDWESFNINSPSDTLKWYLNHSEEEHKFMSPKTISIVDYILYNILYPEEYKNLKAKTSENIAISIDNK